MATTLTRSVRVQWLNRTPVRPQPARWQSSLAHLQQEMPFRKIQPIFDDLCPQSSYRLDMTLADFLPATNPPPVLPATAPAPLLPLPHHLIYFEPTKPASHMLPDGTNPDQSPGKPFERRMWAGGRVLYNTASPLRMTGERGVCAEFIRSVDVKGKEGEEKLFVRIERRLALASEDEKQGLVEAAADNQAKEDLEHRVRQRLWRDRDDDFGPCSVLETRNIVFLRARTPEELKAVVSKPSSSSPPQKKLTPQHAPTWSHTITPDPKLLFRFSALTFNAHAIHLDPQYCREVEGHRERLFHGPLSFVFMLTLLQQELAKREAGGKKGGGGRVKSVEYRNLAPLYCGDAVRFCGTELGGGKWEIWTETPEGGVAVKGTVLTG